MKFKIIILVIILVIVIYKIFHWKIIRIILRKLCLDVIKSLNTHKIDYWVDFGTLLGIYRDNDIILGDNDIDIIVVDSEELHRKMEMVGNDMINKCYKFKKMEWSAYRVYYYTYHVDIYINKKDISTGEYIGATGKDSNIPIKLIDSTKWSTWKKYNLDIKVPSDLKGTLEWRYGKDYMTPKHGFKGRDAGLL
jgi:phosphorylcholine metabolism protein LicD